jgi:hypothetical protein
VPGRYSTQVLPIMIIVGPISALICFFGIPGLLAGKLIAALVIRQRQEPRPVGRWAAWAWLLCLAGTGVGLAIAALSEPDGAGLGGAVAVMFLWFGFMNAVTGYASIRSVLARAEPVF